MFKTTFQKFPPKTINYRCYRKFSQNTFLNDLSRNVNLKGSGDYSTFEDAFIEILDKHAPRKKKIIRGNNKPFVNKPLKNAIATRSRLRKIANKTGDPLDISKYKKQRNFVKRLNDKTQKEYFKTLDMKDVDMSKKFWKTFKPFFSTKYTPTEKMIIVEKGEVLTDDRAIAECMNDYFVNITKTLEIKSWPEPNSPIPTDDDVATAINKYKNHPSI